MDMYHLCLSHMNRRVRVHTHYGCFEGVVVDVDRDNLYLRPSGGGELTLSAWGPRFGFGFGGGILALSLFTLLAIALI